jgi:hypothetical protein
MFLTEERTAHASDRGTARTVCDIRHKITAGLQSRKGCQCLGGCGSPFGVMLAASCFGLRVYRGMGRLLGRDGGFANRTVWKGRILKATADVIPIHQ